MDYNALLPIIFYRCACFYSFFGIYTLATNAKSRTNWQFFFLMISLTIWSFTYAMAYSVDSAETRIMWKSLGVFGWSLFYVFFLRFAIILTKRNEPSKKPFLQVLFYLPALITIILFGPFGFLMGMQYEFVPGETGLFQAIINNIGQIWVGLYPSAYTIISLVILIRWRRTIDRESPLRRLLSIFLISIILPFIIGIFLGVFPRFFGLENLPRLTVAFLIPPAVLLFIALRKFGMVFETKTRRDFSPLDPKTT